MARPVTVALVCPDGLSIVLFCKGIIRSLLTIPGARVIVICDAGEYHTQIESLGVTCLSVPLARWIDPVADVRYCLRLAAIFKRESCDIVLNFSTKANIYGSLAARLARVPVVLSHVVGLGLAFHEANTIRQRGLRWVVQALYRRALAVCRKVWFTNANDLAFFVEHGIVTPDQCVLTRNYLDVSEYALTAVPSSAIDALRQEFDLAPGDRVVVMVARMIWPKGIREFADAAERLKATHPELVFLLVAPMESASPGSVPESFIREKERTSRLRWLGFRHDVKSIYALCDIAVLPSYYKEGGYPRALLEPMAMGKPLITTTSADCRGAVDEGQNGFLVPPRDATALADAIAELARDPAKRAAFGRCSHEKAWREFDEAPIVFEALSSLGLVVSRVS